MKALFTLALTLFAFVVIPVTASAQHNGRRGGNGGPGYAEGRHDDSRVDRRRHRRDDRRDDHRYDRRDNKKGKAHHQRDRRWEPRHGHKNYRKNYKHSHPRPYRAIPRGHYPAPGLCRIWYPGVAPGHQPAPVPCGRLHGQRLGDVVVIGHQGIVFASHPWYADHPRYYRRGTPYAYRARPKSGVVIRLDIGGEWYIGL